LFNSFSFDTVRAYTRLLPNERSLLIRSLFVIVLYVIGFLFLYADKTVRDRSGAFADDGTVRLAVDLRDFVGDITRSDSSC
jgi:hypothetical protein